MYYYFSKSCKTIHKLSISNIKVTLRYITKNETRIKIRMNQLIYRSKVAFGVGQIKGNGKMQEIWEMGRYLKMYNDSAKIQRSFIHLICFVLFPFRFMSDMTSYDQWIKKKNIWKAIYLQKYVESIFEVKKIQLYVWNILY